MKRVILLFTAAVLLISAVFSSCTSAPDTPLTPYEKYVNAAEKSRAAFSLAARATTNMAVTVPEEYAYSSYSSYSLLLDSEIRRLSPPEGEPQMEAKNTFFYMYENETEGDATATGYRSYYKDGYLYSTGMGYGRYTKNKADADLAFVILNLLQLEFDEADAVSISSEPLPDGERIHITLPPEKTRDVMNNIFIYTGIIADSYAEDMLKQLESASIEYGNLDCEMTLNSDGMPVSCTVSFDADGNFYDNNSKTGYSITLDDIRFDTLSEIRFPKALEEAESYEDYYSGYGGYGSGYPSSEDYIYTQADSWGGGLWSEENGYASIYHDTNVINNLGSDCDSAIFLSQNMYNLGKYFWLINQTQHGVTAPAVSAGFTSPEQISTEGLARFFIFSSGYYIDYYADTNEEIYYLPDPAVEGIVKNYFSSFNYTPEALSGNFKHDSETLLIPFSLCEPAFNACRVETAEVLDADRVKLTATGLDRDLETPVNTQEIVLFLDDAGNVFFESYTINPLGVA